MNIGLFIVGVFLIIFGIFNGPLKFLRWRKNNKFINIPDKVLLLNIPPLSKIDFLKKINVIDLIWKALKKSLPTNVRTVTAIGLIFLLPMAGAACILFSFAEEEE